MGVFFVLNFFDRLIASALALAMAQSYKLTPENAELAAARGLANPKWFRPRVDPKAIRHLMIKSDTIPLRDTALWLGILIASGTCAALLWPSWWSAPFWIVYGVMYGSAADSRWHECGHQTAFKTAWLNTIVYQIASFMMIRNPYVWRASHVRHHTDTIIVGRDPEIVAMRPPDLAKVALNFLGLRDTFFSLLRMCLHASGRVHEEEMLYTRAQDFPKVYLVARIWVAIYLATLIAAFALGSILPLMLVGLPRVFGAWHHVLTGMLQHLGLAENVSDHRLNTRTVLMNPVSRFIYLNMNYHLEHHMFTMVPYYNLPKLHDLIKQDLPEPEPSLWAALRRLMPVLLRQLKYEDAVIVPDLPKGALPYRDEVEALRPHAV